MKIVGLLIVFGLVALTSSQRRPFDPFNLFSRRPRPNGGGRRPAGQSTRGRDCGGCPCSAPNYKGQYVLTWRIQGCQKFTAGEAQNYCRNNGMQAVSLDTNPKANELMGLLAQDRQRYFWTGGQVQHNSRSVRWPSGRISNNIPFWSNTGGARRPQPDNREGDENCLAVLNNFYNDGIKYHDVSCHHRKPTICQA